MSTNVYKRQYGRLPTLGRVVWSAQRPLLVEGFAFNESKDGSMRNEQNLLLNSLLPLLRYRKILKAGNRTWIEMFTFILRACNIYPTQ